MFTTARGRPVRPRNAYRRVQQLIERAGLPKTGLHGFRRTGSSIARDETKDILAVAKLLGHSRPDVTTRHYARAAEDAAQRAADAIGRVFFDES